MANLRGQIHSDTAVPGAWDTRIFHNDRRAEIFNQWFKEREEWLRKAHIRSEQSKIDTIESWIVDSTDDKPKDEDDCGCGCEDSCDT